MQKTFGNGGLPSNYLVTRSSGFSKCSSMVGLEHNYRLYKLGFRCVCLFDFMYGHGVLLNLSGEEKECVHFSFTSSSTTDVNILKESLADNSRKWRSSWIGGQL